MRIPSLTGGDRNLHVATALPACSRRFREPRRLGPRRRTGLSLQWWPADDGIRRGLEFSPPHDIGYAGAVGCEGNRVLYHIVITRFNLRRPSGAEPDDEWCRHRMPLFWDYTYASMKSQRVPADAWIILRSPRSAPWLVDKLSQVDLAATDVRVWSYDGDLGQDLMERIEEVLPDSVEHIVTTRLDNDDVLAQDFVGRVRSAAERRHREFLNLPWGFRLKEGVAYAWRDPSNAFISLCEPRAGAVGVFVDKHTDLSRHAPVRQLGGPPAWVQVVHDANLRNSAVGIPLASRSVRQGFPALPDLRELQGVGLLRMRIAVVVRLALRSLRHPSDIASASRAVGSSSRRPRRR